jgi:hypothetical protein
MLRRLITAYALLGFAGPVDRVLAAQLVTDTTTQADILRAAFPNAVVSVSHRPPLEWKPNAWPGHELTDALQGEMEFDVVGAVERSEQAYATGMAEEDLEGKHETRRVRIRVYGVNSTPAGPETYVAVAHYKFTGIKTHALCCEWYARLLLLSRHGQGWFVSGTGDSMIYRAKTVRSFRILDIEGGGREDVLIEAENTATGYRRWISMSLFRINGGHLARVAQIDTLSMSDGDHTDFMREIERPKIPPDGGSVLIFPDHNLRYRGRTLPEAQDRGGIRQFQVDAETNCLR